MRILQNLKGELYKFIANVIFSYCHFFNAGVNAQSRLRLRVHTDLATLSIQMEAEITKQFKDI